MQEKGVPVVPFPVEGLRARSNRGVGLVDAPGKRERHSERHFSHRPREDRRRRQHVDPAAVAFRVIDVGQEIAFHVEDSPELGCAVQPFQGKRRLSRPRRTPRSRRRSNSPSGSGGPSCQAASQSESRRALVSASKMSPMLPRIGDREGRRGVSFGGFRARAFRLLQDHQHVKKDRPMPLSAPSCATPAGPEIPAP